MKKNIFFFSINIIATFTSFLLCGVPYSVNYQGRYKENDVYITGIRAFQFRITNSDGSQEYWKSPVVNLTVTKGLFSYVLNCSNVDWKETEPYIEVRVGPEGASEGELHTLLPREKIYAVPYSFFTTSATYSYSVGMGEENYIVKYTGNNYEVGASRIIETDTEVKSIIGSTTYYMMVPRYSIIMWYGSIDSIPPGWALCDGTNGTPDLRDKFIVCAGGSYSVGATGGSTTHTHWVDIAQFTSGSEASHTHSIDPPNTATTSEASHTHSINPPATTSGSGGAAHTHAGNTLRFHRVFTLPTGNAYNSYYMTSDGDYSNAQHFDPYSWAGATGSGGGAHTHSVDIPAFTSGAGSAHSHSVDISAFTSGAGSAHSHTVDPPNTQTTGSSNLPPYYGLFYIMKL